MTARLRCSMKKSVLFMLLGIAVILSPSFAQPVTAHPLGNFTVNQWSRLTVARDSVAVMYVVDKAEIPTFQEFGANVPTGDAVAAYLDAAVPPLVAGLALEVDGQAVPLTVAGRALSFPEGQGGLPTTRIELQLSATMPPVAVGEQHQISYQDTNFDDRLGWREIVVAAGDRARIDQTDATTEDRTDALRTYPQDMLASPPNQRTAQVAFVGAVASSTQASAVGATAGLPADAAMIRFAALIAGDLTGWWLLLAIVIAMGLGAVHGLSPGHGKAIVAGYLVGARGTARHAFFLGLTVTVTHTLGVFTLGLITLYASRYILPEQLYPWLGVLSGVLVVVMGVSLGAGRLRSLLAARRGVGTGADAHNHAFGLMHEHGPDTHTHLPRERNGRITWKSLLVMGISGGLLPCPSALVVMLSAIALGRVGVGLLLIIAFSVGLAGTLTGIGLLFVYSTRWLQRLSERPLGGWTMRVIPLASAALVTVAGVIITGRALVEAGFWTW